MLFNGSGKKSESCNNVNRTTGHPHSHKQRPATERPGVNKADLLYLPQVVLMTATTPAVELVTSLYLLRD